MVSSQQETVNARSVSLTTAAVVKTIRGSRQQKLGIERAAYYLRALHYLLLVWLVVAGGDDAASEENAFLRALRIAARGATFAQMDATAPTVWRYMLIFSVIWQALIAIGMVTLIALQGRIHQKAYVSQRRGYRHISQQLHHPLSQRHRLCQDQ